MWLLTTGDLHNRRLAAKVVREPAAVIKLFGILGPRWVSQYLTYYPVFLSLSLFLSLSFFLSFSLCVCVCSYFCLSQYLLLSPSVSFCLLITDSLTTPSDHITLHHITLSDTPSAVEATPES